MIDRVKSIETSLTRFLLAMLGVHADRTLSGGLLLLLRLTAAYQKHPPLRIHHEFTFANALLAMGVFRFGTWRTPSLTMTGNPLTRLLFLPATCSSYVRR